MAKILGFRAGSQQKIERGMFRLLRKKSRTFEILATSNVQEAFSLFKKKPILTGGTRRATNAHVGFGVNKMLIRFRTANDVPRGWRVFPLLGRSTSAKYGERNWLKRGALLTKQRIINNK